MMYIHLKVVPTPTPNRCDLITDDYNCCTLSSFPFLQELVSYSVDYRVVDINARDNAGYTALHKSCVHGHAEVAQYLLRHGADVNASATGGTRYCVLYDALTTCLDSFITAPNKIQFTSITIFNFRNLYALVCIEIIIIKVLMIAWRLHVLKKLSISLNSKQL